MRGPELVFWIVVASAIVEVMKLGAAWSSRRIVQKLGWWRYRYRLSHGWEIRSGKWVKPKERR